MKKQALYIALDSLAMAMEAAQLAPGGKWWEYFGPGKIAAAWIEIANRIPADGMIPVGFLGNWAWNFEFDKMIVPEPFDPRKRLLLEIRKRAKKL